MILQFLHILGGREMQQQFLKNILPFHFFERKTIIVAVSGGVDSMVLLHLLERYSRATLIVAHVNHQLREESKEEEKFVRDYCEEHGLICEVAKWDVGATIQTNIEQEARKFRYAFFEQLVQKYQANYVATAHHGDDQIETILMRLVRGSSVRSLAGILSQREFTQESQLVRLLLGIDKESIYQFAAQQGVTYREDASNDSLIYQRNRYRHQVIPLLKQENGELVSKVQQLSLQLQDMITVLEPQLQMKAEVIFLPFEEGWRVEKNQFQQQSPEWQRLVVQYFFEEQFFKKGIAVKQVQVDKVVSFLQTTVAHATLELQKDWKVIKSYQEVLITTKKVESEIEQQYFLLEKKEQVLEVGEYLVTITNTPDRNSWCMPMSSHQLPLTIRHRNSGDKVQIQKNPIRHQKLKYYFINQKIPLVKRNQLWLVEDKHQVILALINNRIFYQCEEIDCYLQVRKK